MTDASLLRAYRSLLWRLRLRRGIEAAAVAACAAAISALAGLNAGDSAVVAGAGWVLAYLAFGLRPACRNLSPAVFADHLDRRFPEIEESARLMLTDACRSQPMVAAGDARRHRVGARRSLHGHRAGDADQERFPVNDRNDVHNAIR